MPAVVPISEMQRNSAALTEQAVTSKEPIYLTKHGKSTVVLMDAEEFDRRMQYRDAIAMREQERYERIMCGHREVEEGQSVPLDEALIQLGKKWGW